jgi:hypothetical protein
MTWKYIYRFVYFGQQEKFSAPQFVFDLIRKLFQHGLPEISRVIRIRMNRIRSDAVELSKIGRYYTRALAAKQSSGFPGELINGFVERRKNDET